MEKNPIMQVLKSGGLTHTSDGLLMDFVSRENYSAATRSCNESIIKRRWEIRLLKKAKRMMKKEIIKNDALRLSEDGGKVVVP